MALPASRRTEPLAGLPAPDGNGPFPSLLFAEAQAAGAAREQDEDRSFAADLNLGQIVAAIAGDREEHDFITSVLFGPLRDAGAVRYRQEVFQDLDDPALFEEAQRFAGLMRDVRTHLRQITQMQYRYQREGWLLDAAGSYCDAVQSLAGRSPRRSSAPVPSWPSGSTSLPMWFRPVSPLW